jgi:hypothetical protein
VGVFVSSVRCAPVALITKISVLGRPGPPRVKAISRPSGENFGCVSAAGDVTPVRSITRPVLAAKM